MKTYSLYYLRLKGTEEIRYVGITTKTLRQRLSGHIHASTKESNTYPVVQWIRKHGKENIDIVLMEELNSYEDLLRSEVETIKRLRDEGIDLLNRTDGGEGRLGSQHGTKVFRCPKNRRKSFAKPT